LDVIYRACSKFIIELSAWAILDNHYHILVEIKRGRDIPMLINNIHTNSSRLLNELEDSMGRKIWYQYYDRCIRSEKDYWTRFNYIHQNCVKHRYSKNIEGYKYSSYQEWIRDKGAEWMADVLTNYPIVDFSVEGEVD